MNALPLLLSLCALSAATSLPAPPPAPPEPDWDKAGAEAVDQLSGYLAADTVNPPGNELNGARYLAAILQAEGIPYEIDEFLPGRANLYARLTAAAPAEKPICLTSHIDVVTAEADKWQAHGPLSGAIADGYVWGRGALDMKGMGMIEVMAMVWAKRLQVPLRRDIVLLAVADEEVDSVGMRHVVEKRWDEFGCSHAINEGGMGIKGLLFEGQTAWAISTAEKGVLWARMVASGEPGHGSTPRPDMAPERLHRAVEALYRYDPKPKIGDQLYEFLARAGRAKGGVLKSLLSRPLTVRALLTKRLMKNPVTRAGVTDTIHVTGFGGANQPNVVPSEVWANLDCRLLPGTTPEAMLARLRDLTEDVPGIRFDVLSEKEANTSPWEDPFFDALAAHLTDGRPDQFAGPVLSVGFTDSLFLRPLGVRAYGIVPFEVDGEEMEGMHGHNERVSTRNVQDGLRKLYRAVMSVSMAPAAR